MSVLQDKYKDQYILFIEAGFMAIHQMDEPSALKLFKAAETINPDSVLNKLGLGYLHLCKMEIKKAVHYFELILKDHPEHELAKAYLAISKVFSASQAEEGKKILEELKESQDPQIQKLAADSLEFVDKFLKRPNK